MAVAECRFEAEALGKRMKALTLTSGAPRMNLIVNLTISGHVAKQNAGSES